MEKEDLELNHDQDAPLDEDLNNNDAPADPQEEEEENDEGIDYKALLEEETALRIIAEEDRDNYKRGLLKKKGKLPLDEDDDDAPVTTKTLASAIEKVLGKQSITGILAELSSNPHERALILQIYNSRIIHTGSDPASVRGDLLNAQAIANKSTILKREKEVQIALKNKAPKGVGAGGPADDAPVARGKEFTPEQLAYFKKRGIDPSKVKENLNNPTGIKSRA